MRLYISQSVGNALHARTISLGSAKIISNAIARSIDRRQNIVPHKSAQQRRHVDAKQQVRNASARNKLKRITKQDAIICVHSCFVFCCFWSVLFGYGSRSMGAYSSVLYHLHEAAASPDPRILRSSYPHYISQLAGNALHARTISLGIQYDTIGFTRTPHSNRILCY